MSFLLLALALLQPQFELVTPALFAAPGGQPNAWADFDGDGDLDFFVGMASSPNRLYRNDAGRFVDVARELGVADDLNTRAAAWGDYDGDGDVDLYVGFQRTERPNRIYRNDGSRFVDVAGTLGIEITGTSRQAAWIDYDGDGDLDLFAALRDRENRLFRNEGARFVDVTADTGIGDSRRTVGAVWWDFDGDGDLDLFVANQNGDENGFFENDGGQFEDVADALGVSAAGRTEEEGGVGPSLADYDGDGDLDLFVSNYGSNTLYRNDGGERFTLEDVTLGGPPGSHATTSGWGDFDNDGRPDLYIAATINGVANYPDFLYRNGPDGFENVLPEIVRTHDATHGIQWVDFDRDGDVDLSLTGNGETDGHYLHENQLPAERRRDALAVSVPLPGAEVRIYAPGTRTLLGVRVADTGSGYCSQSAAPLHFGVPGHDSVDLEVTFVMGGRREIVRVEDVRLNEHHGRAIDVHPPVR